MHPPRLTPVPSVGSIKAPHEKQRPITFPSHLFPIYTIPGQMVCCQNVRASTMPRTLEVRLTKEGLRHCSSTLSLRTYFCSGPSPVVMTFVLEGSIPASALNAQESKIATKYTKGFSTMLDIFYSKFCVDHRQFTWMSSAFHR